MRAKICGITCLADALFAVEQGAWALGFNFYSHSPRYIDFASAKDIIRQLPAHIVKVGIVMDPHSHDLEALRQELGLDLLQLYQAVLVPAAFKKHLILSLQLAVEEDIPDIQILKEYGYLLLDAPKLDKGMAGGTGRLSNWDLAKKLVKVNRLILAGGLNPDNVQQAIQTVQPYAVDVASGVSRTPGRLSYDLVREFLST